MNSTPIRYTDPSSIPLLPGVYLFKAADGAILYIGKAKNLRKRVAQYFQQRDDWKVKQLLDAFAYIECIVTHSEHDALLLEARLIQDHTPLYNTLLKQGNPFIYIRFRDGKPVGSIEIVRVRKERGRYFGPFLSKRQARAVVAYLIRTFRLGRCKLRIEQGCLDYHLGRCAGTCRSDFDVEGYAVRLALAEKALRGSFESFEAQVREEIERANKALAFEKARHLYFYLQHAETIFEAIKQRFSDEKYAQEIERVAAPQLCVGEDYLEARAELQELLGLAVYPHTIDCFDISHFQSTHLVGSCVRFTEGRPDKQKFRRFRIKSLRTQNDYASLQEIVLRRYRDRDDLPDIIMIDGGKGQRNAVKHFFDITPVISLAKREEILFTDRHPEGIPLSMHSALGRLLIALRDYTHHFAVTYHRTRRSVSDE